jgi:hypothetical protein
MQRLFVTPNDYIARARELREQAARAADRQRREEALYMADKLEHHAYARYATTCAAD